MAFTSSKSVRFGVESDTNCLSLRDIALASALRAAARGARQGASGSRLGGSAMAQAEEVAGLRRGRWVCLEVFSSLCLIVSLLGFLL